jgi:hypothetical protein
VVVVYLMGAGWNWVLLRCVRTERIWSYKVAGVYIGNLYIFNYFYICLYIVIYILYKF